VTGASPQAAAKQLISALRAGQRLRVLGVEGSLRGFLLAQAALGELRAPVVYVAQDDAQAQRVGRDCAFFLGCAPPSEADLDGPVAIVPDVDVSPYADVSPDVRAVAARLAALARLREPHPPSVVIVSVRSLMRRVIAAGARAALELRLVSGEVVERDEVVASLVRCGYTRVDVVEDPGTFALRGGVMDVFVPRLRFPVRIEWFDDEIERMRLFDPESQRSQRAIETVVIHPVRETVRTTAESMRTRVLGLADQLHVPSSRSRQVCENLEKGLDFFGIEGLTPLFHDGMVPLWEVLPGAGWLIEEAEALAGLAERVHEGLLEEYGRAAANLALVSPPSAFMMEPDELVAFFAAQPIALSRLEAVDPTEDDRRPSLRIDAGRDARLRMELEAARKQQGAEILRPVVEHLRRLTAAPPMDGGELAPQVPPWTVIIAAPNLTHAERMSSLLRGYGLELADPRAAEHGPLRLSPPAGPSTVVQVVAGELSTGFEAPSDRLLLLSESDIFGKITRKAVRSRKRVGVGNLSQLQIGDFVVHVTHGVGRYSGLSKLTLKGVPGDFVLIEYAGADKLYLPVYRLGEIERYVSADAKPPKLDKMGGSTFASKAAKVKAEVRQIAEELLQIYAQREALEGFAYPEGGDMYSGFEAMFPFEETRDQQDAIDAVQSDLSRSQPMDRLVCGDVGFGKTEVALRAAFRVAIAGKQVAVLAPTTVLVQQHYYTFRERMEHFGLRVERLNRLTDNKGRKDAIAAIREGKVDVVVGTHRLLSRDVRFKDLGLVVIDEEQRFGVAQKERFKKLKTQVDVLTLSATPIPRTLHMSLLGIREISLITTPPVDRLAVRTFLTRPSDTVLEEGLRKELARGGQVFYVVPKIQGIEEHARRIRELVPEARVLVAHGQMPPELLEQAMLDFVEHRADVLVSTTIIESGLDIPRANTMFIARADLFGLSQLYQLRGRVGRSRHRAFCYLMVNSLEKLAPDARRRLEAVVRYAELGSGFHVASQDLEIRGAGDLLGSRQTGQIQAVGFEAYSRILSEAVAELRGQEIVRESDPELAFDVPAFLPDTYVEDVGQRLDLYRRFSAAQDIDAVQEVVEELRDRFGDPPEEARNLGYVMSCKTYGRKLKATSLELHKDRFVVRLAPDTPLSPERAAKLHRETAGRMRLAAGDRIVVELDGGAPKLVLDGCVRALATLASRA